jgi:hypothetical protein
MSSAAEKCTGFGARGTRTHDPSEGFREQLLAALAYLGVDDASLDA